MKKKLNKEINNEYVEIFKEKVKTDVEKEQKEIDTIKNKSKEVQEFLMKQMEEKKMNKLRGGMSKYEYDYNQDLLKEIATKKKDLKQSIMMT